MKMLFTFIIAIVTQPAFAIYFDIKGPCSDKPVHSGSFKTDLNDSVGQITVDILDFHNIAYIGDSEGFSSIIGTPIGTESIEVISDTKMRAYGWCYSINGEIPDVMPHKIKFNSQDDSLSWFYAYSTYDSGKWLDYCVPAYKIRAPQFCR